MGLVSLVGIHDGASIGVSNNGRAIMLREDKRMVVVAPQGVPLDFQHG